MKCLGLPGQLWHDYMQAPVESEAAVTLKQTVRDAFLSQPTQHWIDLFEPTGVAFERVNNLEQAAAMVRSQKRPILDQPTKTDSLVSYGGTFAANEDGPACDDTHAPGVGEHNREILESYGFSTSEIQTLQNDGAFGSS